MERQSSGALGECEGTHLRQNARAPMIPGHFSAIKGEVSTKDQVMKSLRIVAFFLVVAGALAACGEDTVEPPPPVDPVATTITVSPATAQLDALGAGVQLSATVLDQNGNAMAGAAVAWSSDNAGVATVNASGSVTATGNGLATVTATSGSATGQASVTVAQVAASLMVTPESVAFTMANETAQLMADVRDANDNAIEGAAVEWASSDDAVATVDSGGLVTAVSDGEVTISATSGSASGRASLTVTLPPSPEAGPPMPTHAAESVISLFSDAYDDVTVDTWSAEWDNADVEDIDVAGDPAKRYSNLAFAGIEFTSATIDATEMTHFRMDLWTADPTGEGAAFRVKLVDFGADGAWSGGDDSEHEVAITAAEGLASEQWVSLDLPLADFGGLAARAHLAQLIISGDPNTVFVDNVYFRIGEAPPPPSVPTEPAPVPTHEAANVISLFSDGYEDVTVDTWSAQWDNAHVEDVEIDGNATKKYAGLVFAGIEFTSATIDATEMTHFHMHVWTPDPTGDGAAFRVKLVDFGADGAWSGGDDTEHELAFTADTDPALATGHWVSLDIPLSAFTGLQARGHLAQLIISGDPNTVYVDNVYLHK